jgi:hypothetical protein
MSSTVLPLWKRRYVLLWFEFIRSPEVHDKIWPLLGDDSEVTPVELRSRVVAEAVAYRLPKECVKAAVRHFTLPPATLKEISDLINPIKVINSENGIQITAANDVTQSEMEDFIRREYGGRSKRVNRRFKPKAFVKRIHVINMRINKKMKYRDIEDELMGYGKKGINSDESNIRTIISTYRKTHKQ